MTKSNVGSLLVFDHAKVTPGSMPTGVQTCVGIVTERGASCFVSVLLLMMTMGGGVYFVGLHDVHACVLTLWATPHLSQTHKHTNSQTHNQTKKTT